MTNTQTNIKFPHEMFNNIEEFANFLKNGIISLTKNGFLDYFINDYKLKNDTEVNHTGYGFKYENDLYLSNKNIPRTITLKVGTKVQFSYKIKRNCIYISVKNGDYEKNTNIQITPEQCEEVIKGNMKFIEEHPLDFNCIDTKYVYVKNGKFEFNN